MVSENDTIAVTYGTEGCGCGKVGSPAKISFDQGDLFFKYDPSTGHLKHIISPDQDTLTYSFDGSLPLSVEWSGQVKGQVDVSYNNDFNVVSQSVNNSHTVNYAYDNDGLLTQAGDMNMTYSGLNGLLKGTDIGNIENQYSYNGYGELTDMEYTDGNQQTLFSTNYSLDSLGRITHITEIIQSDTNNYSYDYDLSGRLIGVEKKGVLVSQYTYDANGNRLSHATPTDTLYGNYDPQDRMLSYGDAIYGYTPNGSLKYKAVNGDTTWYTYDLLGNLISATLPNGDFIEYIIDGQNRRVGKVVNEQFKKGWIYQDQLNPVAALDSTGNISARFVYGTKGHVPDYLVKNDSTYRFITDHLGSVRLVVNVESGNVIQRIDYDEFGNVLVNTNEGFQSFGYAGGLFDRETGLVRFGARDYDAGVGRWTAKDPIPIRSSELNTYCYVNNDPINDIDITGESNLGKLIKHAIDLILRTYAEIKQHDAIKEYCKKELKASEVEINKKFISYQHYKYKWNIFLNTCESGCIKEANNDLCFNLDACLHDCLTDYVKGYKIEVKPRRSELREAISKAEIIFNFCEMFK